jgi:regulator of RNase E activity RraA
MAELKQITRPPRELLEPFEELGTATISSALREVCGILKSFMVGPVAFTPGLKTVGVATTVSFLPRREDIVTTRQEEAEESLSALWAGIISVQDGDVLVVDARANMESGCLGEMLMTAIQAKGARGLVVDGCIRDMPQARELGLPLFLRGATPYSSGHFDMFPWDYNVPVGCGGVLVMPGDIIVADDDGVVVVPPKVAAEVIEYCQVREAAEVFERIKLRETGDVAKYYPLSAEGRVEYEEWKKGQI